MLGILFLIGAAFLGTCLVRRVLRGLLDHSEQILWGTVVGWTLTTLGVYLLARWQGRLTHGLMAWTTAVVWLVAAILVAPEWGRLRRKMKREGFWRPQYLGLGVVLLVFAPIYWRLFSTHMLARGAGGVYSGGSAWQDLSFHAAVASAFLYGENFPPIYTPFPPNPLLYPFLPDFQIAALMAGGLSLRAALITTALLLSLAITGLIYSLAFRIARSQKAAVLATILFLFNGGLGFIDFFRDWWKSGKSFLTFWNTLGVNYANAWERGIHWTNLIADTLLPQRTSFFGLSLGLMIFTIFAIVWRRWHEDRNEDEKGTEGRPRDLTLMLAAGVLTGLLPLFHTHTYVAVGVVSVVLFCVRPRRVWIAFWVPAVLLAAPQLLTVVRHAAGGGIVHFLPGWMGHGEPSVSFYLLRNFGLPLLLAVPAWWAAPRAWRRFYLAFIVLFIFALVVMISPNVFDNGKLTYYWHALNSIIVSMWLVRLLEARRVRWLVLISAGFLAVACIATGIVAVRSESLARSPLFTDEELAAASFVREHTSPRALFLTAPVVNQPILCLAGRPVVRGATAWLWSHGYEFREREADVRRIYIGGDDALELLKYYGVDFVYVGDAERKELRAGSSFFENNFPAVYRGDTVTIYDTRSAGGAPDAVNALPSALREPAPRELAARVGRDPYALLVEFPRTSFFVYRLCKTSYGRAPRLPEFMDAMKSVGKNLYVGANGWEQQLETNRTALLSEWMSEEEFKRAYDGRTNGEFVDALLKNSGVNWGSGERDALVTRLNSGAEQRQTALLRIVEEKGFYARAYNTAYVLVHFFGYLARNPDDPPDTNSAGFDYWRNILDRSGDYRSLSRAFLESEEYKTRQK